MAKKFALKSWLGTALKLSCAGGIVFWLVESGKLDFGQLRILVDKPWILVLTILVWVLAPALLGSLRWLFLLRGLGYELTWPRALKLHLIGFFFNSAMPGAVGGDLVKVSYVVRDNRSLGKTPAMMSVLLDRILGLFGLFTIGTLMILANYSDVMGNKTIAPFATMIILGTCGVFACFATVFLKFEEGKDRIGHFLSRPIPGFGLLKKIYLSFRGYHHHKSYLLAAWGISIAIQLTMFVYFLALTSAMITSDFKLIDLAVIFPIGILTTALPLAPGGIGVGHVAFDSLFHTIGLNGGANVFNVYVLSSLALSVIGAFPFILNKGAAPELGEGEAAVSEKTVG